MYVQFMEIASEYKREKAKSQNIDMKERKKERIVSFSSAQ